MFVAFFDVIYYLAMADTKPWIKTTKNIIMRKSDSTPPLKEV